MLGSDCPLSLRKNPSKFPVSRDQRYDEASDQWYYHFFYAGQPDLNWRNPAIEERMLATLKFWLDRGVDGFRLDAVNTLDDPRSISPVEGTATVKGNALTLELPPYSFTVVRFGARS